VICQVATQQPHRLIDERVGSGAGSGMDYEAVGDRLDEIYTNEHGGPVRTWNTG
jgi:hypothetical protein